MGNSYRVRIGLREIQAMEPNTILWDLEVKGFVARRQFSDVVTFSVVYRTREGTQRWQKLERFPILTPHLARQEAIRVLRAKALGQDPAGERMALRHGPTVAELCDEYSARDNGKKPATIRSDNSRIKLHIKPKLGRLKVVSVTSDHVEDFMRSMPIGSQSRNVGLLGAIFSYAVKKKLCASNPVQGVEKPAQVQRNRRLSEAEYAQFGNAIKTSSVSEIFLLLAVTGPISLGIVRQIPPYHSRFHPLGSKAKRKIFAVYHAAHRIYSTTPDASCGVLAGGHSLLCGLFGCCVRVPRPVV